MIKSAIKSVLSSPLGSPLSWLYSGKGSLLMYHRIIPDALDPQGFHPNAELVVTVKNFEEQIRFISENHDCLDISTAISRLTQGKLGSKSVVVTFDDGYRDNLTLALPVLRKYNVPAVIYITTGLMDQTCHLWWYDQEAILRKKQNLAISWRGKTYEWQLRNNREKMAAFWELNLIFKSLSPSEQDEFMHMIAEDCRAETQRFYDSEILSWEEVKLLDNDPLITIGAHSINHTVFKELSEAELERELRGSQSRLEEKLGHRVSHFAYPFGGKRQAGVREFSRTRELGFDSAVTTQVGHLYPFHKKYLFSLPRVAVSYYDSLKDFQWKLKGLDALIHNPASRFIHE